MKKTLVIWVSILLACTDPVSQVAPLDNARLLNRRDGLPNFFAKINNKEKVTIAYLGGSITEAQNGWRDQSLRWLQSQYPAVTFSGINAGVSGTGSDLGVFRLQEQVLALQPDLVIVEFAVNDAGKQIDRIYAAMEGIVRKIWKQNPHTDICFVYTLMGDTLAALQSGKLSGAATAMEQIAQHYNIPGVCLGLEVAALEKEGKLVFKGKVEDYPNQVVFSADGVHPYPETGHKLYTESLTTALSQLATVNKPLLHQLPAPFMADNWEAAQMVPVQKLIQKGAWAALDPGKDDVAKQLRNRFSNLIKSTEPGAYLEAHIRGRICGLYDVIGPGCGQYAIQIDQGNETLLPRFDGYATYYRAAYFLLPTLESTTHVVRLKVSPQALNKAAILQTRNQVIDNPTRFTENACYASQLMIVGELVN